MSTRTSFVPGVGLVTVIEGAHPKPLLVLGNSYAPESGYSPVQVPGFSGEHPAGSPQKRTRWADHGLWAVIAVGAGALIADGAALWFLAWLIR